MAMSERSERGDVVAGIAFYRPQEGHTTDEAIAMLSPYHGALEHADGFLTSAVVKSIDGGMATAYVLWKRDTSLQSIFMMPELEVLFEELDSSGSVDVLLYDVQIVGSRIGVPPTLSCKHVVGIRELHVSDSASQERLMEGGYEALKGAFSSRDEMVFCGLHKSLDGGKVVEVVVWAHKEVECVAANYWDSLVDSQELHLCHVVYSPCASIESGSNA